MGTNEARLRVLLVDDDPSWRAMLALSLRRAGLGVDTACCLLDALERVARERYDCLLSDAAMLGGDGFELAREAVRLRPGLRVAMVSATASERDVEGQPIERLFPKPVEVEELLGWIRAPRTLASLPRN